MEANAFISALELGVLIVMAASPALFLLCVCDSVGKKVIAVSLFVVSLVGFIGMKYQYDKAPAPVKQVNHLYNYGEDIN